MNKILEKALNRSVMNIKKIKTKSKTAEIFPDNSIFNFSKDLINKIKSKRVLPDDIEKWDSCDFLIYLKSKFEKCLITTSIYDRDKINRTIDKITKNLTIASGDKTKICDNSILKKYFDWCISNFNEQLCFNNQPVSSEMFCREEYVRIFFQSGSWRGLEKPQNNSETFSKTRRVETLFSEIYSAGGLNKLIYDAGIIDSYYFLITENRKRENEALKELKNILSRIHEAVFEHIVEKTFRKAPYDQCKNFNISKLLKPIFLKKGISMQGLNFDSLFVKENEL